MTEPVRLHNGQETIQTQHLIKFKLLMDNLTNSYSILNFQFNEKYFTIKTAMAIKFLTLNNLII